MAVTEQWHSMVTASIGGAENYGKGIKHNPWVGKQSTWARRIAAVPAIECLTTKISMIFEPRFVTGLETCELLEALIQMTDARQILELGMHTGFGSLHMLRAIVGKEGARLTSIDARPAHDRNFFETPDIAKHFEFIEGWTPEALEQLRGRQFGFVFVDSAHDLEHTRKEVEALRPLTRIGSMCCFHDCPQWQTPANRQPPPVRTYLESLIQSGEFSGLMLPSPRQLDCVEEWGSDYPVECSPGLAVLIRQK